MNLPWLQGNGWSHLTCEEYYSIVQSICKSIQTYLSLLSTNQESYASISPFDHNFGPNNYHLANHFFH